MLDLKEGQTSPSVPLHDLDQLARESAAKAEGIGEISEDVSIDLQKL